MNEVINLDNRRKPINYNITITHHWDGRVTFSAPEITPDGKIEKVLAKYLRKFADKLDAMTHHNRSGEG